MTIIVRPVYASSFVISDTTGASIKSADDIEKIMSEAKTNIQFISGDIESNEAEYTCNSGNYRLKIKEFIKNKGQSFFLCDSSTAAPAA